MHTEKTKQKIRNAKLDKKNPNWKGDNVGYISLHEWIKNHKPKPELCENCKESPPNDLANISGEYKREITDYRWLCRKCHMRSDGRTDKIVEKWTKWTKDEIDLLKIEYASKGTQIPQLQEKYTRVGIKSKAHKLGLKYRG